MTDTCYKKKCSQVATWQSWWWPNDHDFYMLGAVWKSCAACDKHISGLMKKRKSEYYTLVCVQPIQEWTNE